MCLLDAVSVSVVTGLFALAMSPTSAAAEERAKVRGHAVERVRERLDRGLVAMPRDDGRVYLGWRLLETDPPDTGFTLVRRVAGGSAEPVVAEPLHATTDLVDTPPPSARECRYTLLRYSGGKAEDCAEVSVRLGGRALPYRSIRLEEDCTFQKAALADLDGDGSIDFVLKEPDENVDPWYKYWVRSKGTYTLEARLHDGSSLWRKDLGWAIEEGIWYSPYIVYDLDGDGRAEVALKTGEGDPRDADGKVTSGPEYLSIWEGSTGKEIERVPWPSREGFEGEHGYNYYCRNLLCVAYLDGMTPCLIVVRGTYNTIKVVAYELDGGKLRELWKWRDSDGGPRFRGQGAHTLHAADIDGDGRDEVILGSAVLDDDGRGLWSTGRGHPDHVYVSDIDPDRPGLEIYFGIEPPRKTGAMCLVEAETGKEIWGLGEPSQHVHSQGLCADIVPGKRGLECYAGEQSLPEKRWLFSAGGELLGTPDLGLAPRTAYWDSDPFHEIIIEGHIQDYGGAEHAPRIEGRVVGVADIIGDWREEVIASVPGELRIYTTMIPAADRRPCLLRDPIYRSDVAAQSLGYTQIPMLSTCIAATVRAPEADR